MPAPILPQGSMPEPRDTPTIKERNTMTQPTKLDIVRTMPPLSHRTPNDIFFIEDSEVVAWLVRQPEVLQFLFDRVRTGTGLGLIEYDPDTKMWVGVDYED